MFRPTPRTDSNWVASGDEEVVRQGTVSTNVFQSPLGMELLATVDWLLRRKGRAPDVPSARRGQGRRPAGSDAGQRKLRLFDDRLLGIAGQRLRQQPAVCPPTGAGG